MPGTLVRTVHSSLFLLLDCSENIYSAPTSCRHFVGDREVRGEQTQSPGSRGIQIGEELVTIQQDKRWDSEQREL